MDFWSSKNGQTPTLLSFADICIGAFILLVFFFTRVLFWIFLQDMRKQLDAVLEQKLAQPQMELYIPGSSSPSSRFIQAVIDLITTEDYSGQVG